MDTVVSINDRIPFNFSEMMFQRLSFATTLDISEPLLVRWGQLSPDNPSSGKKIASKMCVKPSGCFTQTSTEELTGTIESARGGQSS
jgi:hypothetical protein